MIYTPFYGELSLSHCTRAGSDSAKTSFCKDRSLRGVQSLHFLSPMPLITSSPEGRIFGGSMVPSALHRIVFDVLATLPRFDKLGTFSPDANNLDNVTNAPSLDAYGSLDS